MLRVGEGSGKEEEEEEEEAEEGEEEGPGEDKGDWRRGVPSRLKKEGRY